MERIEIADAVHHGPSGEDWVVARVTETHVYPSGWPPCRANLSDCTLLTKATPEQRERMLRDLRRLPRDDERYIADNAEDQRRRSRPLHPLVGRQEDEE